MPVSIVPGIVAAVLYATPVVIRLVEAGVRFIGGCCGSTPAHIAALAESLRGVVSDLMPIGESRRPSDARDDAVVGRRLLD